MFKDVEENIIIFCADLRKMRIKYKQQNRKLTVQL